MKVIEYVLIRPNGFYQRHSLYVCLLLKLLLKFIINISVL